jgi:cytochrome c oxidase cbb3-type subunit 3
MQDKDRIRPYTADGIQEYDNPMPRWWVGLFWCTIIFAVLYLVRYHLLGGPSLDQVYQAAVAEPPEVPPGGRGGDATAAAGQPGWPSPSAAPAPPLQERLKAPDAVAQGKAIFQTNCVPCHGANGEGTIGPNLTDDYWLHGGKPEDIIKSITTGVLDKGMPPWGGVLGEHKVEQVAAYVISLHGTNPPNAKAPQGEKVAPAP